MRRRHRLRQRPAGSRSPATAGSCRCRAARSPASPKLAAAGPVLHEVSAAAARTAAAHDVDGRGRPGARRLLARRYLRLDRVVQPRLRHAGVVPDPAGSAPGLVDLRPDHRRRLPARRRRRHRPGALPPLQHRRGQRRRPRLRQLPRGSPGRQAAGRQLHQARLAQEEPHLPQGLVRHGVRRRQRRRRHPGPREDAGARHQAGRAVQAPAVPHGGIGLLRPVVLHLEPERRRARGGRTARRRHEQRLLPRQQLPRLPGKRSPIRFTRAAGNFSPLRWRPGHAQHPRRREHRQRACPTATTSTTPT